MPTSDKLTVSIIIVTYNSEKHILNCISSIINLEYPNTYQVEIIIIDNCSTDRTIETIKNEFPEILVFKNKENNGYGSGNNIGVKYSNGEYLIIINPDTIVQEGWLEELINPLRENNKLITTPKILIYDGSKINTCGNIIHFTGLAFTRGLGERSENYPDCEYVVEASGCCFAIRKSDFIDLGGFDESIFLYHDDVDFSCKALLNHFKILYIPSAIIKHDYILNVRPIKIYYLEKGRYMILRKYFPYKTILLLLPSLFIVEIITFVYASRFGWKGIKCKLEAFKDGLTINVEKNCCKNLLLPSLAISIPVNQLTTSKKETVMLSIANKIFYYNSLVAKWK